MTPRRLAIDLERGQSPIERVREPETLRDEVPDGTVGLLQVLRREQQALAPDDRTMIAQETRPPRVITSTW